MTEKAKMIPLLCIKSYGYEYYLVEVNRNPYDLPEPCFMGHKGMALHSCKKIGEENISSKKQKKSKRNLYNV